MQIGGARAFLHSMKDGFKARVTDPRRGVAAASRILFPSKSLRADRSGPEAPGTPPQEAKRQSSSTRMTGDGDLPRGGAR